MERGNWTGPGGMRVTAVRLAGAHRVWADFAGIGAEVGSAFLVTGGGALAGRGYYATVEDLARAVDLAALSPG
ncbi:MULTISPECIES: hypothetical protein [Thermomonosporaceae]|uniref:hypothetical protein n=1 Tax=Thermomonosporaceae TaxID=2012 RepID=UPI00255B056B|nr:MULTISPECIES: hypothetical protein [Thermomonosporaceae]MDL4774401.1 hypothetical protein [Actinomadura xylanilytica]